MPELPGGLITAPKEVPSLRHPHPGVLLPPTPPRKLRAAHRRAGLRAGPSRQEDVPDPAAAGAGAATTAEMAPTAGQPHAAPPR